MHLQQECVSKEGFCHPIKPERRPFQEIHMDHLGPSIKSNGKQHVIVLIDGLTKFVILGAVETTDSAGVINFLKSVFLM